MKSGEDEYGLAGDPVDLPKMLASEFVQSGINIIHTDRGAFGNANRVRERILKLLENGATTINVCFGSKLVQENIQHHRVVGIGTAAETVATADVEPVCLRVE